LCLFQINKNRERNQGRYYTIRDCHLIQTGVLFKLIKYPLFRFKCKSDIFNHKQLDWTHTIIINKARIISTRKTKKKRFKKHENFPK
jgi:hypothetical protein